MAIKGSLKEASLADVCQLLALGGKTGCLSVTDRSNFGQIFFDRGRVTYARIVNRRDRLGDLLVRDGALTNEQLQQAVDEQMRQPGVRLGQVLTDQRLITREQLEYYIHRQIEEAIYYLFTWSRGSFYFEADKEPEDADILASIDAESLLLEGARRVDEWSQIRKRIPSLDLIFALDPDRIRSTDVQLTPQQEKLLSLLDGSSSVEEIIEQSGIEEFEAAKALYGFIQAGFARQVGQRKAEPPERARVAEVDEHRNLGLAFFQSGLLLEARREFNRVIELHPDDVDARFHLALIVLQDGEPREAIRRLKRLLDGLGPRFEPLFDMAVALARMGHSGEAELALRQADESRPGVPETALIRAGIRLADGDLRAAETALGDYVERLGRRQPAALYHHYAALLAALDRRLHDARAAIDAGLEQYPDSAPLLTLAAAIAERRGDLDEAERFSRRAVEEDPNLPQAHKSLGDLAYRRARHDDALEHFQRAVELDPDLGDDVYTKLGNIHFKRREREQALESWNRALELNPDNVVVRKNLEVVADEA